MKKSNANSKTRSSIAQLKLNFPLDTLNSVIHAISVKQDSNMTRVYSVIKPRKPS